MTEANKKPLDAVLVKASIEMLEAIAADRALIAPLDPDTRRALLIAAGLVSRPERVDQVRLAKALRRANRQEQKAHDAAVIATTALRSGRRNSLPALPEPSAPKRKLIEPRDCYICKAAFDEVHFFYDSMCPPCAALNFKKRSQTAPLEGRVALVTGARIKIGLHVSLMLLRAGARVIATTRFPHDAARRFAGEPDFETWRHRLQVHGLDLRHLPSVEKFAQQVSETETHLDILINNAAQTVRRPADFYEHLRAIETTATSQLPAPLQSLLGAHAAWTHTLADPAKPDELALWRQVSAQDAHFPLGAVDSDGQQIDLRPMNSWRLTLADVPTPELVEVHLVNAIAPFILCRGLKPALLRSPRSDRHIVNVSAMEAQFARNTKTDKHPHTNMAKAALNMLTRTSAADYAQNGIFMNSVDTGWITDEDPMHHVARKQRVHNFEPPLDAVDGAARILDPVFSGINSGEHAFGNFYKDYRPVGW